MSSTKETVNDEQNSENTLAMQPKSSPGLQKRKIVDISKNEVKHLKIIEEKIDPQVLACEACNKKLKFISTFTCRCEKSFCSKHRFHDKHDCTFDYKNEARNKLIENNPKIVPRKIAE
jgi:hypothetical protein